MPVNPSQTSTTDPTPVLSAIGQVHLPTWGAEPIRLIRLQGASVSWNLQYFITLGLAAALPWALGRPAVVWSSALIAIQITASSLGNRFVKKRGVTLRLALIKAILVEVTARIVLGAAILTAWWIGVARAYDVPTGWVIYFTGLWWFMIVSSLIKARRRGRKVDSGEIRMVGHPTPDPSGSSTRPS